MFPSGTEELVSSHIQPEVFQTCSQIWTKLQSRHRSIPYLTSAVSTSFQSYCIHSFTPSLSLLNIYGCQCQTDAKEPLEAHPDFIRSVRTEGRLVVST